MEYRAGVGRMRGGRRSVNDDNWLRGVVYARVQEGREEKETKGERTDCRWTR